LRKTVSVTEKVKDELVEIAESLESKKRGKVDLNDAIESLISCRKIKGLDLLQKACDQDY
jgi:predicted CopG family antitoxin